MAKKASTKGGSSKGLTPQQHREAAAKLQARARLHHAKADLAEAQNPPKKGKGGPVGYY